MTFLNPLGLLLLGLAIPVVLMHILRPRRTEQTVSSIFLWKRMDRPVTAIAPWQKLRASWLLAAQLAAVILLALLVANPARVTEAPLAQHTVFLIDGSASMQALDGQPDRLEIARERAVAVRDQLADNGLASVVEVGPVPRLLLSASPDVDAFAEAIAQVRTSNGAADFASAFALAEGLETPNTPIGFVLVSDGGLTDEELRLVPSGLTYEAVGSMDTNRALSDLTVEPRGDGLIARVTVAHTGGPEATQAVRIDVDGRTEHVEQVSLTRNEQAVIEVELPPGDRIEAFLEGDDLLALDDRRWAVTSRRSALDVLVVGVGDPFLVAMLESIDGVSVSTASAVPDADAPDGELPDVIVFDQVPIPDNPGAPFLAVAPPSSFGPVEVAGVVELPVITLVRTDDVLLRDVDLSGVGIAEAVQVSTVGAETLVAAESAPLLVRGDHGGRSFVMMSFAASASNLPVQVAWPILGDRIISELGGSALPPADLVVGRPLRFAGDVATITDPGGRTVEVAPGDLAPVAERPGWWTIAIPDGPTQVVAVNPDVAESTLAPAPAVPSAVRTLRPGEEGSTTESSWRPWLIAGLLAVLAAEWLLARRRVGVSRRQWGVAQAMRLAVALALVGALFNLGFDRSEDQVATVFVIDASDSLGAAGQGQALEWVRAALDEQPDDALAGVVLFGGDARIESLVQSDLTLSRLAVQVDPSRTDLAAAIRLGSAVLPTEAKRRVVLLSDGRATTGDVITEAKRLAENGVAVDVQIVGGSSDSDSAVVTVNAPGFIREGEALPIEAEISAAVATTANVSLFRDGDLIEATPMDLEPGTNTIRFVDPSPPPGLSRYWVQIDSPTDPVPQNNRGFAPVQVGAANGVLIIEGTPGAGQTIAEALEAGGTPTTVSPPTGITTADRLLAYDAIMLVDVASWDLAPEQTQALVSAVRDTGRGLITVGGTQSYGVGGYLGSELETVLPVVSDILDPLRRQTVAEVIAIDTSGSMGACHCAENGVQTQRIAGGLTKTDIAAAGAARTIAALSETDQVGVIAFDVDNRWVVDLQTLPSAEVVSDGLGSLFPNGGTDLSDTLETAAAELRQTDAALKHIILFSDGFTNPGVLDDVADDAAALFENEGITVSVIATGEGAAEDLRPIADAGGGRFYPGRDLERIPQIILEEALQASRDFINEGEFFPQITANDPVVRNLSASPPLLGYVASTAKPTATTLMTIGPDQDPLLARWQVGLGRATSWTSDASARWSQQWASWDGYVEFWNNVVRDAFPSPSGAVETRTNVSGDVLRIEVDSEDVFVDGSRAVARVTSPDGSTQEVPLDRISSNTFGAEIQVDGEGIYAVGSAVSAPDGSLINGAALASRAYSFEYRPGAPDEELMNRIALITGGRADVEAADAFDGADLASGISRFSLVPWFLWFAALLWPLAVAVSRLAWRRGAIVAPEPTAASTNAALRARRNREAAAEAEAASASEEGPLLGGVQFPAEPPAAPTAPSETGWRPGSRAPDEPLPPMAETPPVPEEGASTLDALLARKRKRDTE